MQLSTQNPPRQPSVREPMIPPFAAGFVFAVFATVTTASVAAVPVGDGVVVGVPQGQFWWTGFTDWIAASYARAPALVLGLVVLLAVPPLAFLGVLARRREAKTIAVSEAQTQLRRVVRQPAVEPRDGVKTGHIPLRPQDAWIEVVSLGDGPPSSQDRRYSLGRTLLRIGRETDNDVCLEDMTVHRYHAAIHRTEDAEFVVTDLSSSGGNGVVVNGRAVAEARLSSGDVIELGNAQIKFTTASRG
ncbi:FHA domain-containing protein [Hyphomicrobium sp.]|uniref:FHA domain-containing protein n=1 Tax=Hyphomicrobium sp. TaxID=82 RepID=UPI002E342DDF|nr:FHA domain-containing protein [Hyphomicrobium sp.]HEX2841747.1 FHA domain-containing protein [Hyphomicrobium sp.]